MERRWDIDERGRGVADARPFEADAKQLLDQMRERDWVTEGPEHHLLPAIERACAAEGSTLRLETSMTDVRGVFVVTLARAPDSPRELRADVFALLGEVAESSTHVREVATADATEFHVTTGMLPSDGGWAGHGHTLLLRVRG
jgi:hypothetical protein